MKIADAVLEGKALMWRSFRVRKRLFQTSHKPFNDESLLESKYEEYYDND
jgi:hypothetical protein